MVTLRDLSVRVRIYSKQFEQGSTKGDTEGAMCSYMHLQVHGLHMSVMADKVQSVHVCDSTKWPSSCLWGSSPCSAFKALSSSCKTPQENEIRLPCLQSELQRKHLCICVCVSRCTEEK